MLDLNLRITSGRKRGALLRLGLDLALAAMLLLLLWPLTPWF
jgi:hypothetical protein